MKLWIIYNDGIGFSKIIAEMLQDRLEDYIDASVGNAKRLDPDFLIEEKLDYLIIGDVIKEEVPSLELQRWLLKFGEISNSRDFVLRCVSGFCVTTPNITVQPLWIKFLEENVKTEMIFPPLLHLKLNLKNLTLENGTLDLVKKYSDDIIEYYINNEKGND
ncbi:MAG: hypothetical protein EAX89_04250 [Candidatus Lokiarchaeota archaeon]|nr:hypothetical protein [Candidatus Lokiarchaeota archaeon]